MSAQEPIAESTIVESNIASPESAMPDSNGRVALAAAPQPIIKSVLILFAIFTVFTGLAYPALITAVAHLVFPHQAEGSLVYAPLADSQVIGSRLVGQAFTAPQYFWPRPSATNPAYNAAASSGSNLGPTNPDYLATVAKRVEAWRNQSTNPSAPASASAEKAAVTSQEKIPFALQEKIPFALQEKIPVDIVTASASGLDPDISPAAARMQIERVARARSLSPEQLRKFVAAHIQGRDCGLLGDPRVNVLELNLALDRLTKKM